MDGEGAAEVGVTVVDWTVLSSARSGRNCCVAARDGDAGCVTDGLRRLCVSAGTSSPVMDGGRNSFGREATSPLRPADKRERTLANASDCAPERVERDGMDAAAEAVGGSGDADDGVCAFRRVGSCEFGC